MKIKGIGDINMRSFLNIKKSIFDGKFSQPQNPSVPFFQNF